MSAKRGPGRPKGRAEVVNVLLPLPPAMAEEVKKAAKREGLTRVAWLRHAAMRLLMRPAGEVKEWERLDALHPSQR